MSSQLSFPVKKTLQRHVITGASRITKGELYHVAGGSPDSHVVLQGQIFKSLAAFEHE